jgi:hypothetical protein
MASETLILREIRLELGKIPDVVLWRNNVGSAEYVSPQGDVMRVAYGLCPGSSDLIGMLRGGRFLALEVKTATGRSTKQQEQFMALVKAMGGVAAVVRSSDEAVRLVCRELGFALAPP